jgi:hypothetical protein
MEHFIKLMERLALETRFRFTTDTPPVLTLRLKTANSEPGTPFQLDLRFDDVASRPDEAALKVVDALLVAGVLTRRPTA